MFRFDSFHIYCLHNNLLFNIPSSQNIKECFPFFAIMNMPQRKPLLSPSTFNTFFFNFMCASAGAHTLRHEGLHFFWVIFWLISHFILELSKIFCLTVYLSRETNFIVSMNFQMGSLNCTRLNVMGEIPSVWWDKVLGGRSLWADGTLSWQGDLKMPNQSTM